MTDNSLPPRAVVFLDIRNMFNSVLRQELFYIIEHIEHSFPELLPMANLLYGDDGTVHHQWEDGSWKLIDMREGLNQGCPFSAVFAAMVLDRVLQPLNMELNERAADQLNSAQY